MSNFVNSIFNALRSNISLFFLRNILGWKIQRDLKAYDKYREGKYVAIYLHTSLYDHLIAALFSYALNLRFITIGANRSKRDTQNTGFRYLAYSLFDTIIIDPNTDRKTTCASIINDLKARDNFVFTIYPEGSIYRTSGLKSGFYRIANSTIADILLLDLNYNRHEVDLRHIIDYNVISTSRYGRISEIATEEMANTIPFDSTKTFLLNRVHKNDSDSQSYDGSSEFELFTNNVFTEIKNTENNNVNNSKIDGKPTSLIDLNRSLLRFVPLMTIVSIIIYFMT